MERLVALCLRRPAAVLVLAVAWTAVAGVGAAQLRTEMGYRAFLGASHPALRDLDLLLERFGGGLPMAAVFACGESPCDSALGPEALRMSYAVARALSDAPAVTRVDAPATSPILVRELGLPEMRRLAPGGTPVSDRARLAARALEDPMWRGQLVSADGRAGAILVHLGSSDTTQGAGAVRILQEALAPWEARGFQFHLVGGPVEFVVAGGELAGITARLGAAMVAAVGIMLTLAFRSAAAAAVVLVSVALAMLGTAGLQGALGWPRNTLTEVLLPLVLVMGVCDAVHLLAAHAAMRARGASSVVAMQEAARRVARPCVWTTLTTVAGFASFAVSELESFVRFGTLAAVGVVLALLASFTVLPVLAVRIAAPRRPEAQVGGARVGGLLAGAVQLARRRAGTVVVLAALAGAAGVAGFAALRVEASFEDLYGEQSQVVRWARAAAQHLREPETLEIALVPPQPRLPPSADTLRAVARLEEELAALPGLAPGISILSPLRAAHELLHGGPLPLDDGGARAASMFRLVRSEEPDLLQRLADPESGAVRLSLQASKLPQDALRELLDEVERRVEAARPPGHETTVTGALVVVGRMIDAIRATQLQSFAAAALLVTLLMAVLLHSVADAMIAITPTLLAVAVTLGAMGATGIPLDIGSAMVAAAILGLAVDDAIHVLMAWRVHRSRGEGEARAMENAVGDVGRALVTTSLSLAAGFAVMAAVPWRSIASFGRVAALATLGALVANLVVLPALVDVRDRARRALGQQVAPARRRRGSGRR